MKCFSSHGQNRFFERLFQSSSPRGCCRWHRHSSSTINCMTNHNPNPNIVLKPQPQSHHASKTSTLIPQCFKNHNPNPNMVQKSQPYSKQVPKTPTLIPPLQAASAFAHIHQLHEKAQPNPVIFSKTHTLIFPGFKNTYPHPPRLQKRSP